MLQHASFEKRGSLLREICVIDEHLKYFNDEAESVPVRQGRKIQFQ